ncbi:MAG: hypothetical protein AKCLJLPJ_00408 [Fimbriimonadales bacterium]|nr:hypothetical protein [Fimbriimonadales bacterium]
MMRDRRFDPRVRRRRAILEWMAWSVFYAFVFPFLTMTLLFNFKFSEAFVSSLLVSFIGGVCMTGVFLGLVPYTRRFAFLPAIGLQLVSVLAVTALGFFLSVVVVGWMRYEVGILDRTLYEGAVRVLLFDPTLRPAYGIAIGMMLLMSALGQISAKLGPGVLWSWMLGRYHRPREEVRIFMFLDLKDSTPIAERLGADRFSRLIQEFFRDVGDCLPFFGGRVSHFIGDEAVIYWRPKRGLKSGDCVQFFFALRIQIESKAESYRARYGFVPGFKAGLHIGEVVAAEVTGGKSEIVLHGDAVNTTARIVAKCAELGEDLLVSGDAAAALDRRAGGLEFVSLGEHSMKGKSKPVELFAVRVAEGTAPRVDAGLR